MTVICFCSQCSVDVWTHFLLHPAVITHPIPGVQPQVNESSTLADVRQSIQEDDTRQTLLQGIDGFHGAAEVGQSLFGYHNSRG